MCVDCVVWNIRGKFSPTANIDYSTTLQPNILTFPAESMAGDTQCFDVTIIDDILMEGVEDFFLNVVSTSSLVSVDPGTNQATVCIFDDECRLHIFLSFPMLIILSLAAVTFVLDMSSYTTVEGQGAQVVLAVLQSGILAQNVVVTVQTPPNPQATATGNRTLYRLIVVDW